MTQYGVKVQSPVRSQSYDRFPKNDSPTKTTSYLEQLVVPTNNQNSKGNLGQYPSNKAIHMVDQSNIDKNSSLVTASIPPSVFVPMASVDNHTSPPGSFRMRIENMLPDRLKNQL